MQACDHCNLQGQEFIQLACLALLNIAQSTVISLGLALGLAVCVRGVAAGELTVGDAVRTPQCWHIHIRQPDSSIFPSRCATCSRNHVLCFNNCHSPLHCTIPTSAILHRVLQ